MPELAMQWMVEMVSGEIFGPVHLHAVVDFFHSHLVRPGSRLTNQVTGEVATVADLVLPLIPDTARNGLPAEAPAVAENTASAGRLITFNQGAGPTNLSPDQPKDKLQPRIEQLQAAVDESKTCVKQLQGDLDSQQAQTLKLSDDTAALEKMYLVKLGDVQKNYDVAANMIKKAEAQIQTLNAALAEKEQQEANAARDWDSVRLEKESRIQALTRQIEVLTADETAMRATLEQSRAEFEQARQETRNLATQAKELNGRIYVLDSQVQNMSESLAASAAEVSGQREHIEATAGEHPQEETQLQTRIEEMTGRCDALNQELDTVRGELTGRETDIKSMAERVVSMENSVTEAGNEVEQQKTRCQGLQQQLGQTEYEFNQREMFPVPDKTKLEPGDSGSLERKGAITLEPDRRIMSHKPGKSVLVVDDSEVIQRLIAKLAGEHGASVTAAASAKDVTGILAEKDCRFDLFVLDLMLPEITGWEILETLRAKPETKDTPIVIFTGALSSQEKEKILQKANAVIEKSKFTLREFDKILNQWL
ncbi:MAG: response regulator [Lentisphaerae bacterium]|nr:response regulator [Lentisphaerota bacterium]